MTENTGNNLKSQVIDAIKEIFDPEIPINIYDLGLIYGIDISDDGAVTVQMTLTTPNCPVAETLPEHVRTKIEEIDDVRSATVVIVWEPTWSTEKMTEDGKLQLEFLGLSDLKSIHAKPFTDVTVGRTPPHSKQQSQ